ncbi:hypothetical protein KFL_000070070 [Klebsormidium nitens]|uniref:Uncharacterized protein n=1 Tax=Klebsormidium nitens TaxID=105231 RepID=A0A1Y1HN54_KLENI|nr:hypothetical protein KFL_000070070 [Klebsormidium nitens]|eukprot:GAQ78036.1 hypothetical protein KFL_000070070 [Klebsormidium nitens]
MKSLNTRLRCSISVDLQQTASKICSDWEAAFGRSADAYSSLAPGKRPDTLVLRKVPSRWLGQTGGSEEESTKKAKEIFHSFGEVRNVHVEGGAKIKQAVTAASKEAIASSLECTVRVQFTEVQGLVKALEGLCGRVMRKAGTTKIVEYEVNWDREHFFSPENCARRAAELERRELEEKRRAEEQRWKQKMDVRRAETTRLQKERAERERQEREEEQRRKQAEEEERRAEELRRQEEQRQREQEELRARLELERRQQAELERELRRQREEREEQERLEREAAARKEEERRLADEVRRREAEAAEARERACAAERQRAEDRKRRLEEALSKRSLEQRLRAKLEKRMPRFKSDIDSRQHSSNGI